MKIYIRAMKFAIKKTINKKWIDLLFAVGTSILWKKFVGIYGIFILWEVVSTLITFVKEYKKSKDCIVEIRKFTYGNGELI